MPRPNIPHEVDQLADELISKKDFYPNKTLKKRKELAYAISWKQHNKKIKKSLYMIELIKTAEKLELQGKYDIVDEIICSICN